MNLRQLRIAALFAATTLVMGMTSLRAADSATTESTPPVTLNVDQRPDKPVRPPRPEKAAPPDDVKSRMEQFKAVREAFLSNQKDLTRKLKDATQEERDKIREQIQLQKQQFKAQAKELAQQVKESARDLDPALGHKAGQEGGSGGRGGRPDR